MKPPEFDDIGDAIREGRALRSADAYRIQFALENIDFNPLTVVDPIPLGRQILEAAGLEPDRGYSLFAIVETGDFEDVRLDEPFDLRGAGAERFIAFLRGASSMSRALFSRSADLAKLREEGFFVQVVGGFLVMREVPYVDAERNVRRGTLISSLALAGDQTRTPDTHVIHFDGDYPCFADGTRITAIANQTGHVDLGHGLTAEHAFSSKPDGGYPDYYHKMTTYASILAGPAAVLDSTVTTRPYQALDEEGDNEGVFNYVETASDRVGIGALTARLAGHRIAIIGLGGSGSYILDMVAKTPVAEIRLFDADEFLQHNAFRAPGAPSLEKLREAPLKVEYFKAIYGRMHRAITAIPKDITTDNLDLLEGIDFAFLSLDAGEAKAALVKRLHERGVAFIDIGMGLELGDRGLSGILRITTSTPATRETVGAHARIPLAGGGAADIYASNIQVADLNALNAVLAVIKWKKLCGFYCDLENEHHSTYTLDGNMLLNEDQA
jgi:hypothetical protein